MHTPDKFRAKYAQRHNIRANYIIPLLHFCPKVCNAISAVSVSSSHVVGPSSHTVGPSSHTVGRLSHVVGRLSHTVGRRDANTPERRNTLLRSASFVSASYLSLALVICTPRRGNSSDIGLGPVSAWRGSEPK